MLSSKLALAAPGGDAEVAASVEPWAAKCPQSAGCWEHGGSRLSTVQVFPVSIPYCSCAYLLLNKQIQPSSTVVEH